MNTSAVLRPLREGNGPVGRTRQLTGFTILSTQNSTKVNSKAPVSSHPLFPAIVALWFGALFGLGSLAVRASLIESLVVSSHLDVIVPMAAPPLGMTARILLALFMAILGIAAGAVIARRIARPKPVSPNRRRTAASVNEGRKAEFVREVQAQQVEQQIAADKADAVRRRALASEEAYDSRPHRDEMPLPGSAPQILDVTQFDLAAPGSFEADLAKEAVTDAPLDLTGFAAPQVVELDLADQAEIELANIEPPEPSAESYGDDTDSLRAKFANVTKPVEWSPEAPPSYAETSETIDLVDDAEFDAESADSAALRRFDTVPQEAEAHPQSASDFTAPSSVSDFVAACPEVPAETDAAAAADLPALRQFDGPAGASLSGLVNSPVAFAESFADNQTCTSEAAEPAATSAAELPSVLHVSNAAERIASAELAELSPIELVERFALALKQRRHMGAFPAGLLATAAAFDLPVGPQPSQVPEVLAAMAPFGEAVVTPEPEAVAAPDPEVSRAPEVPVGETPLFAADLSDSTEADDAPVAAMRIPLALPVAMRPIEFGQHEEHDDLPGYVPPRSIAMPRPVEAPADAGLSADNVLADDVQPEVAPHAESAAQSPTEPEAEADVSEEAYSSLLALTRTAPLRQTFVRIEEPTGEFAQVEPVVIFPGQATRPGTRFARPSDTADAAEPADAVPPSSAEVPHSGAPGLRRFDVPTGVAAAGGVRDPAESERALRSALATLQRMSGAA